MSLKSPVKKTVLALAMIVPFALGACSSEEGTEDSAANSGAPTSSSSVPATTSAETSTSAPSSAAPSSAEESTGNDRAGAEAEALASGENPLENVPTVKPVESGQAASQEDVNAITGLVQGLYETTTMREFFRYMPEHSCQAVLNANDGELAKMDYNQVPDVPMDSLKSTMQAAGEDTSALEGFDWNSTGVDSINDVLVNGDDASATVNVNTNNGIDSTTMRFKREAGNWTFCGEY